MKLDHDIRRFLIDHGLANPADSIDAEPLTGGVASDIWRVKTPAQTLCVKRALPQLKVEQEWLAPVERNAYEVAWFNTAAAIVPAAVPQILAHDAKANIFAMEYLPPAQYKIWKSELRGGNADTDAARGVAQTLSAIHQGTGGKQDIAARFDTDEMFFALRPEPYLLATGQRHPALAERLQTLAETTMRNKKALVHGDVSPKNILIGPRGPVFLDAECAWYGDPAFDLAFCLNHMLLKCVWNPAFRDDYIRCFHVIVEAYFQAADWEPRAELEQRTAHLLPGLLLGRVDGKSPVEYLTDAGDKEHTRTFANAFLTAPAQQLHPIAEAWRQSLA